MMREARPDDATWRRDLDVWLRAHGEQLGIRVDRLQVDEITNPSGWHANIACTVSDGATRLHVKLGAGRDELRRTYELRDQLTTRYHAPAVLAWIDLGDLAGLCMPSIVGASATEELLSGIIGVANALHADHAVAAALPPQPTTVRQAFVDLWIERFYADLDAVEAARVMPPFVSRETRDWMRAETSRLADLTWDEAFDQRATSAVHNDLHPGNVLVEPDGRWWILDWDDMRRGDPAVELAIILAPLLARGAPVDHYLGRRDHTFVDRFAVCMRAVLLDEVIDSLADWVTADDAPAGADAIRAAKQAVHERAIGRYRERYTG